MSRYGREDTPMPTRGNGNGRTQDEDEDSNAESPTPSLEELTSSDNPEELRDYYIRLVNRARALGIDMDGFADTSNDEIDVLTDGENEVLTEDRPRRVFGESEFNTLPAMDANQEMIDSGVECAICLGPPELGDKIVVLECEHLFHRICIIDWLDRHPTCPLCRQRVVPVEYRNPTVGNDGPGNLEGRPRERHVHWA
ncbi:hypothetical protein N7466_008410 [Penicillium verhagenii]|uniref:uncharacterized protein n=1 Tax=Penicillium verhagenii TaxID=1562060 RepID=UPI002545490B|nr:uncharacterized protein N7466_008410 [Penicillium verhagenii]KAJ5924223.1 hypothetical protein N7466_008410 [Penicillium verhagenii]